MFCKLQVFLLVGSCFACLAHGEEKTPFADMDPQEIEDCLEHQRENWLKYSMLDEVVVLSHVHLTRIAENRPTPIDERPLFCLLARKPKKGEYRLELAFSTLSGFGNLDEFAFSELRRKNSRSSRYAKRNVNNPGMPALKEEIGDAVRPESASALWIFDPYHLPRLFYSGVTKGDSVERVPPTLLREKFFYGIRPVKKSRDRQVLMNLPKGRSSAPRTTIQFDENWNVSKLLVSTSLSERRQPGETSTDTIWKYVKSEKMWLPERTTITQVLPKGGYTCFQCRNRWYIGDAEIANIKTQLGGGLYEADTFGELDLQETVESEIPFADKRAEKS